MRAETGYIPDELEPSDMPERSRIVLVAGGGGGSAVAPELVEQFPDSDVAIITGVGDGGGYEYPNGGGATREVRRVFGVAAPGDIRTNVSAVSGNQAGEFLERRYDAGEAMEAFRETGESFLTAMQERNEELSAEQKHDLDAVAATVEHANQLAEYLIRNTGRQDLRKHTWGNFLLTALMFENDRDIAKAAIVLNRWAETKAEVMPSTIVVHDPVMNDGGTIKFGEGDIDLYTPRDPKNVILELKAQDPSSRVGMYRGAFEAAAEANTLIIAPGSQFSTQESILSVEGWKRAADLQKEVGKLVLLGNIVEEEATPGMSLGDSAGRLVAKLDREFDLTIYNKDTGSVPEGKVPLSVTDADLRAPYAKRVIGAMLLSSQEVRFSDSDEVAKQGRRATTLHDVAVVADVLREQKAVPAVYAKSASGTKAIIRPTSVPATVS